MEIGRDQKEKIVGFGEKRKPHDVTCMSLSNSASTTMEGVLTPQLLEFSTVCPSIHRLKAHTLGKYFIGFKGSFV